MLVEEHMAGKRGLANARGSVGKYYVEQWSAHWLSLAPIPGSSFLDRLSGCGTTKDWRLPLLAHVGELDISPRSWETGVWSSCSCPS